MFSHQSDRGTTKIEFRRINSLEYEIASKGEMKNDVKPNELEKASEHIIPSHRNKHFPIPLQEDKESDVQHNGVFH